MNTIVRLIKLANSQVELGGSIIDDSIYFSDSPVLLPNGSYANGRLIGSIRFSEQIKVFAWTNRSQGGFGDFEIINRDGIYNSIVDYGYTQIEIYEFDGAALEVFGCGEIDNIGFAAKGRIKVTIKSALEKLKVELPTGRFTTPSELANEKKQLILGQVNLIEPQIIDSSVNEYFLADGLHSTVDVLDDGLSVNFTEIQNGYRLDKEPSGRVLVIAQGHSKGLGYEEHIQDHIARLLSNVDIEFNAGDLASIWPGISSSWSGKNENVIDAINQLLDGFVSYMFPDSFGVLRFGRLQLPASPIGDIFEREVLTDIVSFRDRAKGVSAEFLNDPNANPYDPDQLAFNVSDEDKINLIKEYRTTTTTNGLHSLYQNKNVKMKSQSLGGSLNATLLLNYIISLWSLSRRFYTFSVAKKLQLNEVWKVTHRQKNLASGKDLLVIGKEKFTSTNKINYTFWG